MIFVHITEGLKAECPQLEKACLCSAEDLVQATNADQIEKIAPLETANTILSIMLEYESKLNHIFLAKKSQSIMKERRNSQFDEKQYKERPKPVLPYRAAPS